MNSPRRLLPVGIQTLAKIRERDAYYVDKTALAWSLVQQAGYYFLSRPRRFGKSLFVDTLKEMFECNEKLFKGLYVHDKWDWQTRFPVIHISFNDGGLKTEAELQRRLANILRVNYERLELDNPNLADTSDNFGELIRRAHAKYQQRVVILVDEYDKPILDNLHEREAAIAMREGLKSFYSVIKGADASIHFTFLTGVSKFSKVSLFSGLNNLRDITILPEYSAICGYTDQDLDTVFAPELAGLDRDAVRRWYNGYNWLGEAVYNPFDLLLLFQDRKFRPYWFESGTPAFLVKLLAERQTWLPTLGNLEAAANLLSTFDVDYISTEALMFQTGYLTLDEERMVAGSYYYKLRFPNEEVRQSLYFALLEAWSGQSGAETKNMLTLYGLLERNDLTGLKDVFHAFFAGSPDRSIPHQWFTRNKISEYEGYYASVFYAYFVAVGLDVRVEDASNFGRIDMTVKLGGHIILFEFKVVDGEAQGGAMQQLKDKCYAEKYRAEGLPIHLIGVEFSKKTRNVVGFEVELLG
jgi:Predicted AAA-ATPase/PD-(D/E)XK nuclease superfamily